MNGGRSLGGSGQPSESVSGAERPEPTLFTRDDLNTLTGENPDGDARYDRLLALHATVAAVMAQVTAMLNDHHRAHARQPQEPQGGESAQKPKYETFGGS